MRLKAVRSGTINLGYYARSLVKKKSDACNAFPRRRFSPIHNSAFACRVRKQRFRRSNEAAHSRFRTIREDRRDFPPFILSFLNRFEAKDYVPRSNIIIDKMREASIAQRRNWTHGKKCAREIFAYFRCDIYSLL